MNGGYVIARENFKEAEKHVSAENDPVMFNLLFGLQSLTTQIEADIAVLLAAVAGLHGPAHKKARRKNQPAKKMPGKRSRTKKVRRSR
jgi:hypothetical protein